jgi:hypothetical protein
MTMRLTSIPLTLSASRALFRRAEGNLSKPFVFSVSQSPIGIFAKDYALLAKYMMYCIRKYSFDESSSFRNDLVDTSLFTLIARNESLEHLIQCSILLLEAG